MESGKLPNFAVPMVFAGKEASCKGLCLNNCSCSGYSFDDGNGCLIWEGDLVDNNQFVDTGETFYLRLAGSELSDNNDKRKKVLLIVLGVAAVVLCLLLVLILKFRTKVKVCFRRNILEKMQMGSTMITVSSDFSYTRDLVEVGNQEHAKLSLYNFSTIEISTNNFSSSNKLGQGGFGPVYMGKLPGGQEVAVKRLSKTSGQGLEEFKNELILIAKLQHRNLVRLIGWCIEGDEKILIYEYMPNKSLDAYIFGKQSEMTLNWKQRFNIIEGIARGLLYLHQDSRLRIIHRDLKASNILLDEEMNPKISDFGMAKIFGGNENQANTNRVVGTYGYMSPEYAMKGLFSMKSDVYSFGVLLLEIVSGKRNPGFHISETSLNLIGYAWDLWKNDKAIDLADPFIRDDCSNCQVMRCIHVGLLCVQDLAMDRPTMSSVVLMLGSEVAVLPTPRQPNFSVALSSHGSDIELPIGVHEQYSSNMESMSTIVPR